MCIRDRSIAASTVALALADWVTNPRIASDPRISGNMLRNALKARPEA